MENFNDNNGNEEQNDLPPDDKIEMEDKGHKNIQPQISPVAAAFLGLIGGFFLYQVVGGLLTLLIFGLDVEHAPVNSVRLMTMGGQILFILLPALIFARLIYYDVGEIIRARLPKLTEIFLFVLGIIVLTPLLQNYLYIQNIFIERAAEASSLVKSIKVLFDSLNEVIEKTYGNLLAANSIYEGIFVILVIAVIPALSEEVMFRGFVQRSFEFRIKPFWAALVTAVFFGLYHFNPYGIIPLVVLGFYFGFAAYLSNSIVIPIILHFLNNFTAVLLFFILGDEEIISSTPATDINLNESLISFVVLLLLFSGVVLLIRKYYSKQKII